MTEATKDRIKRWAKGLLVLVGAFIAGSNEFPQVGGGGPAPCRECVMRGLKPRTRDDCPTAWHGVCPLPPGEST
jgi:hypothetical protein